MFWVRLTSLAGGSWIVGYLFATRLLFPAAPLPSGFVAVPDLGGVEAAAAQALLAQGDLELGAVDSLHHPEMAEGRIFAQSPLPGQAALAGAAVRVTISDGPLTRTVPDVRGISGESANALLAGTGFGVVSDTTSSDLARGRVVGTEPEAGTALNLPGRVTMILSSGPPPFPMPSVVGMPQADAITLLDSLRLVVAEVREVFRFGFDRGLVVIQEPAAGTEVRKGDQVLLGIGWSRRTRRSP